MDIISGNGIKVKQLRAKQTKHLQFLRMICLDVKQVLMLNLASIY